MQPSKPRGPNVPPSEQHQLEAYTALLNPDTSSLTPEEFILHCEICIID